MANKNQKPQEPDKNALQIGAYEGESADKAMAREFSRPETQAAITIRQWQDPSLPEKIDINETMAELKQQTKELKAGKMDRAEEMLLSQAQTLDELFNTLARRAHRQEYMAQFETYLKLSLKAQNQCRMTLETLSNIKNPPVVYAKQANISHGPQQVNNGPHAAGNENKQTELLTENHGKTLDRIGTGETIGSYSALEAMG